MVRNGDAVSPVSYQRRVSRESILIDAAFCFFEVIVRSFSWEALREMNDLRELKMR